MAATTLKPLDAAGCLAARRGSVILNLGRAGAVDLVKDVNLDTGYESPRWQALLSSSSGSGQSHLVLVSLMSRA